MPTLEEFADPHLRASHAAFAVMNKSKAELVCDLVNVDSLDG